MGVESFDDFNSTEKMAPQYELKEFQFREDKTEAGTLQWLNENFSNAWEMARSRLETYRRYHALYKGVHWRDYDYKRRNFATEDNVTRKPKHTVNFIAEMVDQKVAKGARSKISIAAIPTNDEIADENTAKAAKILLTSKAEEINLEDTQQDADRIKFIMGNSFLFTLWDKDAGPISPTYAKLAKAGKVPSKIKGPVHIGDVIVQCVGPDRVFPEISKKKWQDVNHVDLVDWATVDELKALYPGKAGDIKEDQREYYDYDTFEILYPKNKCLVRSFFHKPTKFSDGCFIKYIDSTILEETAWPYIWEDEGIEHIDPDLPMVVDSDIDVYGELWGRSFISRIEQMQRMYNNVQSSVARDHGVGSAPKWMMPKGACDIHSLNNDFTIVEWTGPVAPQLVQGNPISKSSYELQDRLEAKISNFSNVYDISRGEVPTGVTANSALRFLDEQESQRGATLEIKRKKRIVRTYKKMLKRIQQGYVPGDGRYARMLGKNNEYLIESFEKANFNTVNDIKLQNTSALSDTKTGKISDILDLNIASQADPIFRKEEIVSMLDLGLEETFISGATVAVTAAKTVVEKMMNGKKVPEPQKCDNFLVYYAILDRTIQSINFREKAGPGIKKAFYDYILTLEGLMFERAKINTKFYTELMMLDNYPMYFTPELPLSQIAMLHQPPQMAPVQGMEQQAQQQSGGPMSAEAPQATDEVTV